MSEERVWPQYVLAIICNLGTLSYGLHLGWMSPLQPQFMSEDNPLGEDVGAFSLNQISWIGAIPAFTLMFGPFILGFCLQKFGRKMTLLIATIPNIICLIMMIFAKGYVVLLVARLIAGFAACIFLMVPIYVNECSSESIRGFLGCLTGIFVNLGIVVAYIFGNYTSYLTLNLIIMVFPIIFLICFYWIPETPPYLVMTNRKEDAINVLMLLRGGTREKNEEVIQKMMDANEKIRKERENMSAMSVFTNLVFLKGLGIILTLFLIQQFSGTTAIVAYSVNIITESGSSVSPKVVVIVMSCLQVVGSIIGSNFVDRFGRRPLLLCSNIVVFLSLLTFTLYMYLKPEEPSVAVGYCPLIIMCVFVTSYSSGSGSVAFVLLPELFSPQTRPLGSAFAGCFISILAFLALKYFPIINAGIGLAGSFTIFTVGIAFGVVFIFFCVFETKGKSTAEILQHLGQIDVPDLKEHVPMLVTETNELKKDVPPV